MKHLYYEQNHEHSELYKQNLRLREAYEKNEEQLGKKSNIYFKECGKNEEEFNRKRYIFVDITELNKI